MTTVAFDGKVIAADTLAVDGWGLKSIMEDKIRRGFDFFMGFSGDSYDVEKYWSCVKHFKLNEILSYDFDWFDREKTILHALLVNVEGKAWYMSGNTFVRCDHTFHAIGSGRGYAIGAMAYGSTAAGAVSIANRFDNGTNNDCRFYEVAALPEEV